MGLYYSRRSPLFSGFGANWNFMWPLSEVFLYTCFKLAVSPWLLSLTFRSIRTVRNFMWPLTPDDLEPRPCPYTFHTRPLPRITSPKFQLIRSNLKFVWLSTPDDLERCPEKIGGQTCTHTHNHTDIEYYYTNDVKQVVKTKLVWNTWEMVENETFAVYFQ